VHLREEASPCLDRGVSSSAQRHARGCVAIPLGTVAFYGRDNRFATKVVAAILSAPEQVDLMEKWYANRLDARIDPHIGAEVAHFLRRHGAKGLAVTDGIFGCPHAGRHRLPGGGIVLSLPFLEPSRSLHWQAPPGLTIACRGWTRGHFSEKSSGFWCSAFPPLKLGR
jgi:hypothetical protein